MEDLVESLDRRRRRMLAAFLVAFVAWQVPLVWQEALAGALPRRVALGLTAVSLIAWGVWLLVFVQFFRLRRQLAADPDLETALLDERVLDLQRRALVVGFWSLIVYLAVLRLSPLVVELSTAAVTQGGLVVGASAAIGAFLYLDRR